MTRPPVRPFRPLRSAHLPVVRAIASVLSHAGSAYVWLMYRKELDEPLPPYHAKIAIDIGLAEDAEIDTLAALVYPDQPRRAAERAHIYRDRLRSGSLCFVARIDGAIVASNWIRVKTAIGVDQMRMHFGDDEIYTTDAYTAHEWRGQGIHPALNQTMLEHARQQGYRVAYTLVRADNERSSVTMGRVGWRLAATMLYFRPSRSPRRSFWQVWGDPYPMPLARGFSTQLEAPAPPSPPDAAAEPPAEPVVLDLSKYEQHEQVADRPWARTYRLRSGDELAWLKIVPSERAGALQASVILARDFPGQVPAVIACDWQVNGWLLTHDHRGSPLGPHSAPEDLLAMVETYARLQAAAVSHPELLACTPAVPLSHALPALLDFLRGAPAWQADDERVDAAWFIGADAAAGFHSVIRQAALRLSHLLTPGPVPLPETIEHGDLRPSHAAKTADGRIVLFNWAQAQRGPAGLSLHQLFGGAVPALDALRPLPAADTGTEGRPQRLMARYLDTLADAGYADRRTLRAALPASIIAGAMAGVARCALFATDDEAHRELVRERVLAGLDDLRALCARHG